MSLIISNAYETHWNSIYADMEFEQLPAYLAGTIHRLIRSQKLVSVEGGRQDMIIIERKIEGGRGEREGEREIKDGRD